MDRLKETSLILVGGFWTIPPFLRFGVVVFIVSGALDLAYHIVSSFWSSSLDPYLGPDGYYTHLALFFGMLLIVIGVIRTKPQST